jgi:hypothetical protein
MIRRASPLLLLMAALALVAARAQADEPAVAAPLAAAEGAHHAPAVEELGKLSPLDVVRIARSRLTSRFTTLAASFSSQLKSNDVAVAEDLYSMEREAVNILQAAAEAPGLGDREELIASCRSLYARVVRLQETVREHAQRELDRVLPGEKPADGWSRGGLDLWRPLYRPQTPTPGASEPGADEAHAQMLQDFEVKGGRLKDIHELGPHFLESLKSGELAEWGQAGSHFRITTSGAKHPLIIGGRHTRSGRGAGSFKAWKDSSGKILMAVVSNSSGNTKPGPGATEAMVQALVRKGIPESHIIVTSIIPEEPELVKLLLKSKKTMTKEQINAYTQQLRDRTQPSVLTRVASALPRPTARATAPTAVPAPARVPAAAPRRLPN